MPCPGHHGVWPWIGEAVVRSLVERAEQQSTTTKGGPSPPLIRAGARRSTSMHSELYVRPEHVRLLDPLLRAEHQAVVAGLVGVAVADAADTMLALMVPGGVLDPAVDDVDVPWCDLLARTINEPDVGFMIAKKWFVHLHRLQHEDVPVSTIVEGTAAYATAGFALVCGRHEQHRWWMRTAAVVAEHDGLEVVAYLRAARLLRPLLERAHRR